MDFSTIDLKYLKRLPVHVKPPSYHYQSDPGNGCAGDPPGYPTYFTRSVYTQYGNSPHRGAQMVIVYEGVAYVVESAERNERFSRELGWHQVYEQNKAALRRLWKPLPLDHPRVQAWIDHTIGFNKNCYLDPRNAETICGRWVNDDNMWEIADLLGLEYDPALKKKVLRIQEANKLLYNYVEPEYLDAKEEVAYLALDNAIYVKTDLATIRIKEYYPEYEYEGSRKGGYGKGGPGHWWERLAEKPTPETCPGESWSKHPVNGTWCQFCAAYLDDNGNWVQD